MKANLKLISVVLLAVLLFSAITPFYFGKVRLTVRNNTNAKVWIKLEAKNAFYYLRLEPGTESYTIKPSVYKATFWGCGSKKVLRNLDIHTQFRIVFPVCNATAKSTEKNVLRVLFSK
ncbi:MAG: hypothetical protein ACPL3P_07075 [Anaerolineales bacterium]